MAMASSSLVRVDYIDPSQLRIFDDVSGTNFIAGVCIHLAILDAVTGALIELMEADLFALAGRRIERDRA
jgi:hypothetical protein